MEAFVEAYSRGLIEKPILPITGNVQERRGSLVKSGTVLLFAGERYNDGFSDWERSLCSAGVYNSIIIDTYPSS